MTAEFSVGEDNFCGTNGAIALYLETLADLAADRYGPDAPLSTFLRDEIDGFFSGKCVYLDKWIVDPSSRMRFVELLDSATEQLLSEDRFTAYGRTWVSSTISALRQRIVDDGIP